MDIFQKLFGVHEPTLIVIESDRWLTLPSTPALNKAMERRARKEKWENVQGEPGVDFRCIVFLKGGGTSGFLEIHSLGVPLASLTNEQSAPAMEQMRADNGVRATSVHARAYRDEDGFWQVSVNM